MPITRRLSALLLLPLLALSAAGGPQAAFAQASDKVMQRSITVSATGQVEAAPDQARIQTGVVSEAAVAAEALTANSKTMEKLIDGLKQSGIEARDIQTSQFRIEPRYTNPQEGRAAPKIDGYRVVNDVEILVRDIPKLGATLDALVKLGANQMHGLSFEVSKAETLTDDARKTAIDNARRRAELMAAAGGAVLGEVLTIAEDVPQPGVRYATMARAQKASPVPIESGTETLEARVTVTWALRSPPAP